MDPQHWQKHVIIVCIPDLRAMELVNLANVDEETPDNCVEATEHEGEELFEDACEEVEEGSASSSSICGFAACAPLAGLPDLVPEGESEFSSFAKF
jgi:hypothetical protein